MVSPHFFRDLDSASGSSLLALKLINGRETEQCTGWSLDLLLPNAMQIRTTCRVYVQMWRWWGNCHLDGSASCAHSSSPGEKITCQGLEKLQSTLSIPDWFKCEIKREVTLNSPDLSRTRRVTWNTFEKAFSPPHLSHSGCRQLWPLQVWQNLTDLLRPGPPTTFAGPNFLYIRWSMMYTVMTWIRCTKTRKNETWHSFPLESPAAKTNTHHQNSKNLKTSDGLMDQNLEAACHWGFLEHVAWHCFFALLVNPPACFNALLALASSSPNPLPLRFDLSSSSCVFSFSLFPSLSLSFQLFPVLCPLSSLS